MRVHLDTDLGTTMDDLAALVMLLGTAGVELCGITTTIDPGGCRAGLVRHVLALAGRDDVVLAAGAEVSMTTLARTGVPPPDDGGWPGPVPPVPGQAGSALRLLAESIDAGVTVVATGPLTNLALLGVERPDVLARAEVVAMAGWFDPVAPGLPAWGPARDWNVQCDTTAARLVIEHAGEITLVPLSLTLGAQLRRCHLARLRAAGSLGRLLAAQAEHQWAERSTGELAHAHRALPHDLLAFHHDPLTAAVALGWPCIVLEERRVALCLDGDILRLVDDEQERPVRVAVALDADAYAERWLASVEALA